MNWRKTVPLLGTLVLLLSLVPLNALARPAAPAALDKIEPLVLQELDAGGRTDFFVWMVEKADLSPAYRLKTKAEKGRFVYETLVATAERTQGPLRRYLEGRGADYEAFYIANKILVRGGDYGLLLTVAARPDVARITANHQFQLQEPFKETPRPHTEAVEPNITFVKAPQAWALGYTGQGTVLAGNDTGLDEDHPAIAPRYRGCLNPPTCSLEDHNYNWWDATNTYPTDPWDGFGHGTHTTGTMMGDDGGSNQIGVAPGALTIHCKNMTDGGSGNDTTFTTCFQWDLAPWDLNHANPRPDLAPDAINNSWGYWGGGAPQFEDEIAALQAAGIAVEVSAGNEGFSCSSLRSPGDYRQVLTTGSVNHAQPYPGTITGFSSRGPSSLYPTDYFPDVMAPGENIRSAVPGGGYEGGWSGTSMAGPHATALIGLMWSACPSLQGFVTETYQIILDTATPLTGQGGSNCGGNYTTGPNNDWGYGTIDAEAAVLMALAQCTGVGYLDGTVTDAATSAPIEGAQVRAEREQGGAWSRVTNAGGYYTMTVPQGTFTVTASAFGYIPGQATGIVVVTDTVTTQDFALQPAPTYVVSGTVTEAGSGDPLLATVQVLGTPIPPVQTDPATGYYSITVPEGTYTFRASAPLHQSVQRQVVVDHDQTQDFSLPTLPCILLVDDDEDGPDVRSYYTAALDSLGYSYDIHDVATQGDPAAGDLLGYRAVMWFTGYPWGNTFNGTNEAAVAAYLDAGGNFFLSSEDYLYDFGLTPFGINYLGITSYSDDESETDVVGNAGNPIGDGLGPYYLTPPSGWTGSLWTDYVSGPNAPFRFQASGQNNSVNKSGGTYHTVFFAWPFEGIAALGNRTVVMDRIVSYFGGCGALGILTGQVTHDYYGTPIADATVTAEPAAEGAFVQATTDPNGHYTITLAPGTYDVTASKDGYTTAVIEDVVVGAGVTVLDIALSSPVIVVAPESLHAYVAPSGTVTLDLNVANPGEMELTFVIAETTATMRLAGHRPAEPAAVYRPEAVADRIGSAEPASPAPAGTAATWSYPEAVFWDNGPMVTHPGGGFGGADASALQSGLGMNTYGFGNQFTYGYRMADDFTITDPAGWNIDTITFFAYQTGAPTDPSTITGLYFQIWDGPPWAGGNIIWGDLTTNRLLSSTWSGIYRVLDTNMLNTQRPIMANVGAAGLTLPPGTYWLDWMHDGSLSSGPWAPPITILGQTTTGDAYQYTTAWAPALDSGTSTQQGMPFIIEGAIGTPIDVPWISEVPTSSVVPAGSDLDVAVTFTALPPYNVVGESYTATLVFAHNDPEQGEVRIPITMTVFQPCDPVSDADFSWDPPSPLPGEVVTFYGSATSTVTPLTFTWDLGDGTFGLGEVVTHTYGSAGDYAVTMTATNACGAYDTATYTLTVPECEEVTIVTVTQSAEGCVVTFGAVLSGTAPFTYLWDFGPFGSFSQEAPVVDFGASGVYSGTLEVWNCVAGYDTAAITVEVTCGPTRYYIFLPIVFVGYP